MKPILFGKRGFTHVIKTPIRSFTQDSREIRHGKVR